MDAKEKQQVLELLIAATQDKGYSLGEIIAAVTATLGCLVTTYVFIRSVINNGFNLIKLQNATQNATLEKQDSTLTGIAETLMNYKIDTVKHQTCAQRQENLIERIGIVDIKERIKTLEDKVNGSNEH